MTEEKIDGRTREAREMRKKSRRRRVDNLNGTPMNLATRGHLDRENYAYRWINEKDGSTRLWAKTTQDDWDIVTSSGDGITMDDTSDRPDALGDAVRVVVGAKKDGSPEYAYLCRKPKELHEEDTAKRQAEIDKLDDAIASNQKFDGREPSADPNFYNPNRR